MLAITENPSGLTFNVLLTPRSSRTKILKIHDGALKIAIQSPPVDGAANDELVKFLAKTLGLSKRDVTIISGQTSKRKTLAIIALTKQQLQQTLSRLNLSTLS